MKNLSGLPSPKVPLALRATSALSRSAKVPAHGTTSRSQAGVPAVVTAPWTVEPARPSDIFFLVSNVSRFAGNGNFNFDFYEIRGHKRLVEAAANAILRRYSAFRWLNSTAEFLAVRSEGRIIGAALTSAENVSGPEVVINFIVVDEEFHGRGVGKALTRHVIATADREACIRCWCAPRSKAMQCMLRSLRFRRVQREYCVPEGVGKMVMPSCWLLDLKKNAKSNAAVRW